MVAVGSWVSNALLRERRFRGDSDVLRDKCHAEK